MEDGWPAVMAAARDETSGAAEIARAAAEALLRLDPGQVPQAVEALIRGHPSMAPLWRLGTEAWSATDHREGVRRFLDILDRDAEASRVLAEVLPSGVLTISWSSAVIDALKLRRPERVVCMLSEPGSEGARTAAALREAGINAEVMEDHQALDELPADAVAVGADAVTSEGVINKIGTKALAEAAKAREIPCYAVAGESKLVAEPLPIQGPFELVPLELFRAIACPDGVLSPNQAGTEAAAHVIDQRIASLGQPESGQIEGGGR
jgi:translation initiation factor 2B subunit (eIF-2B alpha/beta/delta family)